MCISTSLKFIQFHIQSADVVQYEDDHDDSPVGVDTAKIPFTETVLIGL